ncbi:helix-turn-helix domain-containing protein [Bradyrhizobium sp. LHD-71]|uniref:helix-turn-helix domain-containing protein n=1 Tax=Bradyrhizobium sp. LHD-71 TaxID=3072141 RepID=UPI00280F66CA|nr:helix-turn-helix domain-containing protein [Bradyrhizobium sp. LHD-71]MDQ8726226.1 helix-turn-helix domain-containing protein [Bradyrhizobium sp. LHD-71]
MHISSLKPSSALKRFGYTDLDEFRQAFRLVDVQFTPMCRTGSAEQAILLLPGCELYLLRTFPRLLDASLADGCTYVGVTMADNVPLRFNGLEKDRPAMSLGYGGAGYKFLESQGSFTAAAIFNPEIRGRGWPSRDKVFLACAISAEAEQRIRDIICAAFKFASDAPADAAAAGALEGVKETILAAIDSALADPLPFEQYKIGTSRRYFDIVQKIENALVDRFGGPIYSAALASEIGVSVRTMHNAMRQFRGMSLHRYLRMKRLWSVRRQLLAGAHKVSACALANGFWHLGEFAQFYTAQFGETPSQTLARAR